MLFLFFVVMKLCRSSLGQHCLFQRRFFRFMRHRCCGRDCHLFRRLHLRPGPWGRPWPTSMTSIIVRWSIVVGTDISFTHIILGGVDRWRLYIGLSIFVCVYENQNIQIRKRFNKISPVQQRTETMAVLWHSSLARKFLSCSQHPPAAGCRSLSTTFHAVPASSGSSCTSRII